MHIENKIIIQIANRRRLTAAQATKKPVQAPPSAGFFSATFLLLMELLAQFLNRNSKNVVCLERYVKYRLNLSRGNI